MNLKIFCMTVKRLNVLEKLPSYIIPFGLGNFDTRRELAQRKKW